MNGITSPEFQRFIDFFLNKEVAEKIRDNRVYYFQFTNNFKQISNIINESPTVNIQNIQKIFLVLDKLDIRES